MPISVTVAFAPEIAPPKPEPRCLRLCCDRVRLMHCDNGCCVTTYCDRHPWVMIRDGKVVGTSA